MVLNPRSSDEVLATLKEAGLKLTPQRLAIVEALVVDESHPTVQALFERLRPRFPTLSVATVYNTVSALTDLGCCRQLTHGGVTRLDPNTASHDHAICDRCGAIRDLVDTTEARPASSPVPGFVVDRVEKIYRGICAQCGDAAPIGP